MRPLLHPFALGGVPLLGKGALTPNPDLAGYWPLAKSGAIDLADYSGRAHALTASASSPTQTTGPSNNLPYAAQFTAASSQYFSLSSPPQIGSNPFSLGVWVKPTTSLTGTYEVASIFNATGNQRSWIMRHAGGTLNLLASANGSTLTTLGATNHTLTLNTYSLLFFEWDGVNLRAQRYGNGKAPDTTAFAGPFFTSTATLLIGASGGTPANFWQGSMSQILWRIGSCFSDAEKADIFNAGNGRTY